MCIEGKKEARTPAKKKSLRVSGYDGVTGVSVPCVAKEVGSGGKSNLMLSIGKSSSGVRMPIPLSSGFILVEASSGGPFAGLQPGNGARSGCG